MHDIANKDDVKRFVDEFYRKIRSDELLKGIFNEKIGENWAAHLERMYAFWQTVLFTERTYHGNPFAPHARMPLERSHFERWKALFFSTIDENFSGPVADEAKWRADKMAEMFLIRIEHLRNTNTFSIQ